MVKIFYSWAFALLTVVASATTIEGIEMETEARFQAIEREIADLKGQSQATGDCCGKTMEAGAELTLLRPEIGSLVLRDTIRDEFQVTPDYDLNSAFRVWLGREWSNGLGWRVTYWKFQDSASIEFPKDAGSATFNSSLNLYTVDLEL